MKLNEYEEDDNDVTPIFQLNNIQWALNIHFLKKTHTLYHECLMNDYEYPIKILISVILNTSLNHHNIIFYAIHWKNNVRECNNKYNKPSVMLLIDQEQCTESRMKLKREQENERNAQIRFGIQVFYYFVHYDKCNFSESMILHLNRGLS